MLDLDVLTRDFIRERLTYRFVKTDSYSRALQIEIYLARGYAAVGSPRLNPKRSRKRGP